MFNLYLILRGAIEGKILLQTYHSLDECRSIAQGVVESFPGSITTGQEIWIACEKVVGVVL